MIESITSQTHIAFWSEQLTPDSDARLYIEQGSLIARINFHNKMIRWKQVEFCKQWA
nr:hypothetical protein [Mycoplasmopsis bovis]